jgi:signal recognition particle receptor subunit beta
MLRSEHLTFLLSPTRCSLLYFLFLSFASPYSTAPVLILANKQDIAGAAKPDEAARLLGLADLPPARRWHIQGCCALTGQGLTEGFRWLGANASS